MLDKRLKCLLFSSENIPITSQLNSLIREFLELGWDASGIFVPENGLDFTGRNVSLF